MLSIAGSNRLRELWTPSDFLACVIRLVRIVIASMQAE